MNDAIKQAIEYIENVPDDRQQVTHIDREQLIAALRAQPSNPREASDFQKWSILAYRALDDAGRVLMTVEPECSTEAEKLSDLEETIRELMYQALTLNGVLSRRDMDKKFQFGKLDSDALLMAQPGDAFGLSMSMFASKQDYEAEKNKRLRERLDSMPVSEKQVDYETASTWLAGHEQGLIDGKALAAQPDHSELIAKLRAIAAKGVADYFNSGQLNSNTITEAAYALEGL